MKVLLFLDVTQPKTIIDLPRDIGGQLEGATITHWDVDIKTLPRYCQLRFSDGLVSEVLSNSSHPDLIPVPLYRFAGDPPAPPAYGVPLSIRKTLSRRFIFEIFDEGETPSYLTFDRALFWITLNVKPTKGAGTQSSTRPQIM